MKGSGVSCPEVWSANTPKAPNKMENYFDLKEGEYTGFDFFKEKGNFLCI